jgi:hypothetical protein
MRLWKDVQFSLRTMWKSPRITITVLATLVLGIGANTAIFSIVNATLLKPLPFRDPGQLSRWHLLCGVRCVAGYRESGRRTPSRRARCICPNVL